jgi:hypothetical protein
MISSIMLVSGREITFKSFREFIIAQGLTMGVSNGLEGIASLGSVLFPGVGSACYGATATLGTESLGRAAINYFFNEPLSAQQGEPSYGVNPSPNFHSSKKKENKIEPETKGSDQFDVYI